MKKIAKLMMPVVVLLSAVSGYFLMQLFAVEPTVLPPQKKQVIAEYTEARQQDVPVVVHSQGTVSPSLKTDLTAEVGGKIVAVGEYLHTGGLFRQGEVLYQIDPREYEDAVIEAEAELARAQYLLVRVQAQARQAIKNWTLLGKGSPSDLTLRIPQLTEAQAAVRAAEAHLNRARRNLAKTKITAPYDLIVQSCMVELHGYVLPGAPLATVFSVEAVEIRLPITKSQLDLLELSSPTNIASSAPQPTVILQSIIAGEKQVWQGTIIRAENIFSPKSRVTHVVARVSDPYGVDMKNPRPILAVGMFVQAEIRGKVISDKIVIPSIALRESDDVWLIRDDNTLTRRSTTQLYRMDGFTVIDTGIQAGDKVCVAGVEFPSENLEVKPRQATKLLLVNSGGKNAH